MKKKTNKKKCNIKLWSIIIVACLLIILVSTIIVVVKTSKNTNTDTNRTNVVEKKLNKLAVEFYENKYYDGIDKEIIESFSESGLRVNLKDLYVINDITTKIVDPETGNECNDEETYVKIYPQEPYGKTDYKIEYNINCK